MTVNSIAAAIEHFQFSHMTPIIEDLIKFYHDEWKVIEGLSLEAMDEDISKDLKITRRLIADERTNRIAVCKIFSKIAHILQPVHFEMVFNHLINEVCHDSNPEIKESACQSLTTIIQAQGDTHGKALLQILETFIEAKSGVAATEMSKTQALRLMATLAPFLGEVQQKKLLATFEQLIILMQHKEKEVMRSACLCLPQVAKYFIPAARNYLAQQIKIINESTDEKVLKGSAYAAAGIFKCLGMKAVIESELLP